MAGFKIKIVVRTLEVRRHRRDEVAAVLRSVALAQLDASDLGDGVGLVRGLKRASQQLVLGYRLISESRVDTR